ncbi:MAG: hypothetical protein AB8E82_05885, partial [Aureispira sp.]
LVKNLNPTTKECFMSLEGKVEGEDKGSLEQIFADTDYAAKNGEILRLYNPNASSVSDDETETTGEDQDTATLEANKAKRSTQMGQMREGIDKMDKVKDKAPQDTLNANIAKYETALSKLIEEAKKDGVIDEEEQAQIDELQTQLNALKEAVAQGSDSSKPGKRVNEKARAKINENIGKISDRLDAIVKALNL